MIAKYKYLIIIVIVLILFIYRKKIKSLFYVRKDITPERDPETGKVISVNEGKVKSLANALYTHIYGGDMLTDDELYMQALALNDQEFVFLCDYYKGYLTRGTSLGKDIDDEWSYFSDKDEAIIERTKSMGLY